MAEKAWLELVAPREEGREPAFRAHVEHLSVLGLRIIGLVCLGGVAYVVLVGFLLARDLDELLDWRLPATIWSLGLVALGLSFWPRTRPWTRAIGLAVGYGIALAQFLATSALVENEAVASYLFSGIVTGVMLVGIATLPVRPLDVFGLGAAILATYRLMLPTVLPELAARPSGIGLLFVTQTVLLCTGLTVVVYRQRVLAYRARSSARRALEELRLAQASLVVSENAHAQSRFAAALSHELGTPLGALTSAFHTVLQAHRREGSLPRERVDRVLAEAEASGRASTKRIREVLERMKLLSNLDRAEEQTLDVSVICREAAASLASDIAPRVRIDLQLEPLPPVRCRPQQIGAVVSNLLRNAIAAIDGTGTIVVESGIRPGQVYFEVRDDGRGIPKERLETLFEPSLSVEGARVATRNWGLFVSRAIVTEHGGEIAIESEPGRGTTARVSLPTTAPYGRAPKKPRQSL